MKALYGLLGEKLSHSLSPQIHTSLLRSLGIDGCYHLFQVKSNRLSEAVHGLSALDAAGANVTIPYKISIMECLDELSSEAETIGAVNTLQFKDGSIKGYNTDYYGFKRTLDKYSIGIKDQSFVILGTGGASKAVCQCLYDNKARDIIFVSRRPGENKHFKTIDYDKLQYIKNSDTIINCTPVGMFPNTRYSPISKDILSHFCAAVDLIYNPKETVFLSYARELNITYANGLYMLVSQAAASQEIWHNITINEGLVEKVYEQLK